MAPYLVFGFLLAGLVYAYLPPDFVRDKLGERGTGAVLRGALYGVPLPLCSCSTLPVAVSMRRRGASIGAVGSFLISTPQTGVDSIVVTWTMLGPLFAMFRAAAAFISGVTGGLILNFFHGEVKDPKTHADDPQDCCSCSAEEGCESKNRHDISRFKLFMTYGLRELPEEIGGALILGILIGGIIEAAVPQDLVETALSPGIKGLFLAMLVGIPMYVCATSSVPIALAFLLKGASPGAAFVFLMTGPVTNTAQISAIYSVFGKRNLLIYLSIVFMSSFLFGALIDQIMGPMDFSKDARREEVLPSWVNLFSGLVLSIAIILGVYKRLGYGLKKYRG